MEENTENYKEISKHEFASILKGERKKYICEDEKQLEYGIPSIYERCIIVENIIVMEDIILIKNIYKEPIVLNNCKLKSLKFLLIKNDTNLPSLFIIRNSHIVTLDISASTFNRCEIYDSTIKNIETNSTSFSDKLILQNNNIQSILLQSSEIIKSLIINGGIYSDININSSNIENFSFKRGRCDSFQSVKDHIEVLSFTEKDIQIKKILFNNSNIKNIQFIRGNFNEIKFSEVDFENIDTSIYSKGELIINNLLFWKSNIKKNIFIRDTDDTPLNIEFYNCNVYTGAWIKFQNLKIHNITFRGLINTSNIYFSNVKYSYQSKLDILSISNSDLGKTTFIDCDFEGMKLDFKSSKITEVFLAGTKMPKDITTDDNEQKRLGYGQLKKIYDNRGDTVTANEYFAKEMNVLYDKTLWFGDKKKSPNNYYKKFKWLKKCWEIIKFRGESFSEKFALWLNKFSSNHGTSWGTAFAVTIIFSIISFAIYGCCIGLSPASWFEVKNREIFWNYFGYILEYINPIRKPDSIVEGMNTYLNKTTGLNNLKANGFPMIWDGISRIFNSYFIYQLIQAFRKHRRGS